MSVATPELLLAAADVRIEAAVDKTPAVSFVGYANAGKHQRPPGDAARWAEKRFCQERA